MSTIPAAVPSNVLSMAVKGTSLSPDDTTHMMLVSTVPSINS